MLPYRDTPMVGSASASSKQSLHRSVLLVAVASAVLVLTAFLAAQDPDRPGRGLLTRPGSNAVPGAAPAALPEASPVPRTHGDRIVGYFVQWGIYARNYHVKNIKTSGSAEKLTAINYAFGHIVNGECVMITQTGVMDAWADYQKIYNASESVDGVADAWNQPLRGNFNQLKKLKQMYPHLKVLISLGGWTWSEGFSDAALTPQSRARAASSCIDIYIKGNLPVVNHAGGQGVAAGIFDGVDIDWEYPAMPAHPNHVYRPEDTQNFTLFLEEFRRQLDAVDPNLLLTIAAPSGEDKFAKIEIDKIHPQLDWINLMTYDFHGGFEPQGPTNFHAQLYGSPNDPSPPPTDVYNGDHAVRAYLAAGVPARKLSLGIPFYGRGWTGVANVNNGLYQSATAPAPGTFEPGVMTYEVLKSLGHPGYRDPYTLAFWTYNGSEFWSFDDPAAVAAKADYIRKKGLGGAMVWELDGDTTDGELIGAVHKGLH